jgi:hypothetical protein
MAFRRPEQDKSSPSLGYRLSSNRQPGVEIANNRMPSRPMPRFSPEDMPFPRPGEGRPAPMPMPMPMPMPNPMEPFRPPPGMGPDISPDKFRNYLDRGLRARQGIDSLTPSNIGVDRGPTTMDPLTAMLDNPQVMRDAQYARELEEQMDPNNFLTNRLAVSEQFGVPPFDDLFNSEPTMQAPYREDAALDPSDYRTILKILEAGGNPEDYMAANRGGIASLMR